MKETISIRLERHVLEEIDRVAKEEGTSRTEVIREALRVYFKTKESAKDRSFIPFEEYKRVSEELSVVKFRMGELQAKLEALETEKERVENLLKSLEEEKESLIKQLSSKEEHIYKLKQEIGNKELRIKELNMFVEKLEKEKEELLASLQSKKRWRLF